MNKPQSRWPGIVAATLVASLAWIGCTEEQGSPTEPAPSTDVQQSADPPLLSVQQLPVVAAIRAQERHTPGLMATPGVVGTGIGMGARGRPVVKVLVNAEGVRGLPKEIDGVPVEPLVTGEFYALQDARARQDSPEPRAKPTCGKKNLPPCGPLPPGLDERHPRPVPIGVSTGHPAITAGTIGARVERGADVFALSNNHVYADVNAASIGDDVIQPGSFDGGSSPADDIGTLDDYEPISFGGCSNTMDAAIAATTTGLVGNSTPSGIGYGTPRSQTETAAVNMKVKKVGRTTGFTKGTVTIVNATVNVNYGAPNGIACFTGQVVVTPGTFSAGGDSGSLVVVDGKGRNRSDDRKPVGLLFAGSSSSTIISPIDPILSRFSVSIDGN